MKSLFMGVHLCVERAMDDGTSEISPILGKKAMRNA